MTDFDYNWIKKFFKEEPDVILDVGAYDCQDTIKFRQYCPNASRIIGIEASPRNFKIAKEVCDKFGVECYNYAVCDEIGVVKFYSNEKSMASCSMMDVDFKKADLAGPFSKPIYVPSITLSYFCEKYGIDHIDILHLDVEGAEDKVIAGLGNIRPKLIFAEKSNRHCTKGTKSIEEFNKTMEDLGYELKLELEFDNLYLMRK